MFRRTIARLWAALLLLGLWLGCSSTPLPQQADPGPCVTSLGDYRIETERLPFATVLTREPALVRARTDIATTGVLLHEDGFSRLCSTKEHTELLVPGGCLWLDLEPGLSRTQDAEQILRRWSGHYVSVQGHLAPKGHNQALHAGVLVAHYAGIWHRDMDPLTRACTETSSDPKSAPSTVAEAGDF